MAQRADGKYSRPDGQSYTKYGEKTSEHGHWEVDDAYSGTNNDGTKWRNQTMKWVEDSRKFEAPAPQSAPAPEAAAPPSEPEPIEYSPEIQQAKERVQTYENDVLSGKVSEDIYDASKNSYIKRDNDSASQNYDFSSTTFDPSNSQQSAQLLLDKKKSQILQHNASGDFTDI